MDTSWLAVALFASVFCVVLLGYPVAFALAGTSILFALGGMLGGAFHPALLEAIPNRIFGVMTNETLIAVPLFVFMGVVLERSRLAEDLLETLAGLFHGLRGGLHVSVVLVGMLLAASTGIVGATVVTMGLLSLPVMLRRGCEPGLAAGTICASGTLGQIIPPSIVLVLLGDVLSSAYQQAQIDQGIFAPETVTVGDLFLGAIAPGVLLVVLYLAYIALVAWLKPDVAPAMPRPTGNESGWRQFWRVVAVLAPPLFLMVAVLGSIIGGLATTVEAASVGASGALLLAALRGKLGIRRLHEIMVSTLKITSMVFMILVGATIFTLVFRGYGGDDLVQGWLSNLPGGTAGAVAAVMLVIFLLGFLLDFIEITFVVVPLVAPALLAMGVDPVWLGVMIAINLQTSFLTPPFGFALFYLRGVAPPQLTTTALYRGVVPFIAIQLIALGILAVWPELATWLTP